MSAGNVLKSMAAAAENLRKGSGTGSAARGSDAGASLV